MRVGFTGTRTGTTCEQHAALCNFAKVVAADATEFHHGCCIGADSEAEEAFHVWAPRAKRHAHPSNIKAMTSAIALDSSDVKHPPKPPLDRNRDIVDACDVLVACPKGDDDRKIRGGTGHTVRYAAQVGKPVVLIKPDGTVLDGRTG